MANVFTIEQRGRNCKVNVDGVDIGRLRHVEFIADVNEPPILILEIIAPDVYIVGDKNIEE